MTATIRIAQAARAEERVDLVDAVDHGGPALPKQPALGRIRLGGYRGMYVCRAIYAATFAAGFR